MRTHLLTFCLLLAAAVHAEDYAVDVREVWIPMPDGVRLAATVYYPTPRHAGEKFPAVLEYLPYRKDEMKSHETVHRYFARHGILSTQVDICARLGQDEQREGGENNESDNQLPHSRFGFRWGVTHGPGCCGP